MGIMKVAFSEINDNYGVYDRPGFRLDLEHQEFVVAQALENGFTLVWTTQNNPHGLMNELLLEDGARLVAQHYEGYACKWFKVSNDHHNTYVVFNAGKGDAPNEIAVLGGTVTSQDLERILRFAQQTSTPGVKEVASELLPKLLANVDALA